MDFMHSVDEGLLSEWSVGYLQLRWLRLKALIATYRSSTAGCRQAVQFWITTVV